MSDLSATSCGCNTPSTSNDCGCGSILWIIILMCLCGGNNGGCGDGCGSICGGNICGGGDSCGFGGNWIWLLILLCCCNN